jgi:Nuclease A inhibitor-like protein
VHPPSTPVPSTDIHAGRTNPVTDPSLSTESPDPALRARLERAAHGLTYGSESDRPFEFFFLPGGGDAPPGAEAFGRLVGAEGRVEERSLDDFFARHAETSDPYDVESQRIRPRYEALRDLLRTELRGTTVYRTGRIEVQCFAIGGDGRGNLAGLRTVAIET